MDVNPQTATADLRQDSAEQTPRDGEVTVSVARDGMAAHVTVTPPDPGGRAVTVEAVLDKLKAAGITFGVDLDAVERAVQESRLQQDSAEALGPTQVAWGKSPVNGEDARIDYHEALTAAGGRPKLLEDGRVNLFDLNLVHNVPKGTVLAVQTPATPGEPGVTVLGAEVPPRPGRDLWLRAGRGTSLSEDRLSVVADVDGHATLIDGKVEVTSIYEVPRDVGVETGNIQFVGSVVVRGNVQAGFWVKADGDVEVQGSIDGGAVEARGNITVQYGVMGGGRGRVVAGGAVKARFIENAEVRAGTHVWATDGILQSRVEAGVGVEVMGKRGAIIGGRVIAKDSVTARFLGSAMGSTTEITVGVAPSLREELVERRKKQTEMESNFRRVDQTLQYLADHERKGLLSRDKREMMGKLIQLREQLHRDLEGLKARCQELECALGDAHSAWVQAKDVCYPGVKVGVGPAFYVVTNPLQRTRFRLSQEGEIEVVPIPAREATVSTEREPSMFSSAPRARAARTRRDPAEGW